jgi:hypothetical protein
MNIPGDDTESNPEAPPVEAAETSGDSSDTSAESVEAPTEAVKPVALSEEAAAEAPTELLSSEEAEALAAASEDTAKPDTDNSGDDGESTGGTMIELPPPVSSEGRADEDSDGELSALVIPVVRQSLAQEFWGFIVHNKAWWMTPIVVVLAAMVAFILLAETSPVLPFIYTVI